MRDFTSFNYCRYFDFADMNDVINRKCYKGLGEMRAPFAFEF